MHFALYDFANTRQIDVGELSWVDKFDLSKPIASYSREEDHIILWSDKKSRDFGKKFVVKILSISESKAQLQELAKLIEQKKVTVEKLPLCMIVEPSVIWAELAGTKRKRVQEKPFVGDPPSDVENNTEDTSVEGSCGSAEAAAAPVSRSQKRPLATIKNKSVTSKKFAAVSHDLAIMKDIIDKEFLSAVQARNDDADRQSHPSLLDTPKQVPVTQRPCCCGASGEVIELKSAVASLESTVKELLIPHIKELTTGLATLQKSVRHPLSQPASHHPLIIRHHHPSSIEPYIQGHVFSLQ